MSDEQEKPPPSLQDLAEMVPPDGEPTTAEAGAPEQQASDEELRPTTEYRALEGSAADNTEAQPPRPVDEAAATDLHPAAKPRPKAIPLAEVGLQDQQPEQPPDRPRLLGVVIGLGSAALLTGALVAIGLWGPAHDPSGPPATVTLPIKAPRFDLAAARRIISPIHTARRPDLTAHAAADTAGEASGPVRVPYERRDDAIVIPVRVGGPAGEKSVEMALDDDATYPTLTTKTLDEIGITPTAVRAKLKLRRRVIRPMLAIVDSISTREASVSGGLTVAVCNTCAEDQVEGLLGRSFSRHFDIEVDRTTHEVVLRTKHLRDRTIDVKPFVHLALKKRNQRGHRLTLRFRLHNRAPRALARLVVEATGPGIESPPRTTIPFLAPGAQREATIDAGLTPSAIRGLELKVTSASW